MADARSSMSYWGKVFGGMAGFAMAGPFGMVMGAALGHAADTGNLPFSLPNWFTDPTSLHPARMASLFTPREQVFSMCVVSLAAKLAKADGPVNRTEIDAFKRFFRIPAENVRMVGRLFDQARINADDYEPYAKQLGDVFSGEKHTLEEVLGGLFGVARADGPVNDAELQFLSRTARAMALDGDAWDRARTGTTRPAPRADEPDPYRVLGVRKSASDDEVRAAWKKLVRENHPDTLASQGAAADAVAKAGNKVAMINAAWDRVKRDRKL
jgi:DnaJ like chaperone protein